MCCLLFRGLRVVIAFVDCWLRCAICSFSCVCCLLLLLLGGCWLLFVVWCSFVFADVWLCVVRGCSLLDVFVCCLVIGVGVVRCLLFAVCC